MDVFREQMKSDIAWIRVVRKQMMSDGVITDAEVEEGINQSAKDMSTPKYMVSEIVIKKANAKISVTWLPTCAATRVLNSMLLNFQKARVPPTAVILVG